MAVKLKDLMPVSEPIIIGNGQELMVRAMNLVQIMKLLKDHKGPLLKLVGSSDAGSTDFSTLLDDAPLMVAEIITMGAGEPDDTPEAMMALPAAVQIEALAAIWSLTAPDPKKFLDSLLSMVQGVTGKVLRQPPVRPVVATVVIPPIPSSPASSVQSATLRDPVTDLPTSGPSASDNSMPIAA